jgi:ABC-type multidrug transport system ATPase subunit
VNLSEALKVRELIEIFARYYPNPYSIEDVMELTRTTEFANRQYALLSGGQKRQVQFAIALCGRPELLFLDEPTAGLDVQARHLMWDTIRDLIRRGCSIVLTTHYIEEAEALADRVIILAKGRVVATGSVSEMRGLVRRTHVSCVTRLPLESIRAIPEVENVRIEDSRLQFTVRSAEDAVRQLLAADAELTELEVRRAGLSEVFVDITEEHRA